MCKIKRRLAYFAEKALPGAPRESCCSEMGEQVLFAEDVVIYNVSPVGHMTNSSDVNGRLPGDNLRGKRVQLGRIQGGQGLRAGSGASMISFTGVYHHVIDINVIFLR